MDGELIFARAGFGAQAVDYAAGWDLQRRLHERRCRGEVPDSCLLLEHQPTWHGPGQLVGYPVVALAEPIDVIAYVRSLEEALIRTCAAVGVIATRVAGRSGVWVPGGAAGPDRKVGAIGIRVSRGVTMHGFALNCDCDLAWFGRIVPCGISDAAVSTLSVEAGRAVSVQDVVGVAEGHLADALGARRWRRVAGTERLVPAASLGTPVAASVS